MLNKQTNKKAVIKCLFSICVHIEISIRFDPRNAAGILQSHL